MLRKGDMLGPVTHISWQRWVFRRMGMGRYVRRERRGRMMVVRGRRGKGKGGIMLGILFCLVVGEGGGKGLED